MKSKRVLVTGGSGFIGSHLVKRLLQEGAQVGLCVRYNSVIRNERLKDCWKDLTLIEADLRNRGPLARVREFEPELVFHLAAYNHVGESFVQVEECFDVNAKGTANLLDVCTGRASRFVYMSTSEVYGYQTSVPFVESMTPKPISPYAITKYAGELYCLMHQRMGADVVVLRPFNAYGPYQSMKAVIPELIIKCLRGEPVETTLGEQTREFNYVEDLVEGLLLAAQHDGRLEGVVNLAAGEEISIRTLVETIARLTETTSDVRIGAIPYRPTEIWRMYADASRARSLLGWKPKVPFEMGLRQTVDWFRDYLRIGHTSSPICTPS
ncbi:MAG TPA: GDP-mannose 4,6-dehydratase [Candidatus Xenobia bacterium]|jgi:nucleoside-diphosphate-sugar epimerase